jgi:protein gp37
MMSEPHWKQPYRWNRQAGGEGEMRRVFPSMCDPFELHPQVTAPRERMFEMIRHTHWLNWLLLTKRPENIDMLLPAGKWHNVWLGVSTEDQVRANERVPQLLQLRDRVPVLFLSVEPQIGPVTLKPWIDQLDWVIPGGESGAHHRPFDLAWARTLRDECKVAGVAFHFKQVGGRTHAEGGCLLDGREYKEFPAA